MQMRNHAMLDQPRRDISRRRSRSIDPCKNKTNRKRKKEIYTRNENRKKPGIEEIRLHSNGTVTNEQLIRNGQPIKAAFDARTRRFEL